MKPTLKLSPSTVEFYRTCKLGKYGKNLKIFMDSIGTKMVQSEQQMKGEAYHKLLEFGPDPYKVIDPILGPTYRVSNPDNGSEYVFNHAQAEPALTTFWNHPDKKHEVWGRLNLEFTNHKIVMNLRVDAKQIGRIWDYKTAAWNPKWPPREDTYKESIVWPLYMKAYPECTKFQFRVFALTDQDCKQFDFIFDKDAAREAAALNWVINLVEFIELNELTNHFLHVSKFNNESVRNRN
jgi:hypothetical protein